jgi:hypothetical protein
MTIMRSLVFGILLLLTACTQAVAVKITVTTPTSPADPACQPGTGTITNLSILEVYVIDSHAPGDTVLVETVPVDSTGGSTYVFDWDVPADSEGVARFAARVMTRSGRSSTECGWQFRPLAYDTRRPGQPVIEVQP